jgi:hypothetical protein
LDHTKPLPFTGSSNGYVGLWVKLKKPLLVAKATAVNGTQAKPLLNRCLWIEVRFFCFKQRFLTAAYKSKCCSEKNNQK